MKLKTLLGRKVMTNLDSIFKTRDITLRTKFRLVKAMVFPVVMYPFIFMGNAMTGSCCLTIIYMK